MVGSPARPPWVPSCGELGGLRTHRPGARTWDLALPRMMRKWWAWCLLCRLLAYQFVTPRVGCSGERCMRRVRFPQRCWPPVPPPGWPRVIVRGAWLLQVGGTKVLMGWACSPHRPAVEVGASTRPSPRDGNPGAATGDRVTRGSLRGHRGLRRWFRVHVHAELVALPWDIGPGAQVWAKLFKILLIHTLISARTWRVFKRLRRV